MSKCEHIIGLYNYCEGVENITLKDLKWYINNNNNTYKYIINKYPNDKEKIQKPFQFKDYADRRKSTNLDRYNYCPICGEKIDWKKIKENDNNEK